MSTDEIAWRWSIGEDAGAIHQLLCASDAHTATAEAPAPQRNADSTQAFVSAKAVHVLWAGNEMAATITVLWRPPFAHDLTVFPPAQRPAYITRLSVAPLWSARDPLLGVRCLRHAAEAAAAADADAVRAEANPNLPAMRLLELSGFVECARGTDHGRAWSLLQKPLARKRSSSV
jgi:hypothetical protein